jgi:hypothetical protein
MERYTRTANCTKRRMQKQSQFLPPLHRRSLEQEMKKQSQFSSMRLKNAEKLACPRNQPTSHIAAAPARRKSVPPRTAGVRRAVARSNKEMKKQSQFSVYAIENTEDPTPRPRIQPTPLPRQAVPRSSTIDTSSAVRAGDPPLRSSMLTHVMADSVQQAAALHYRPMYHRN